MKATTRNITMTGLMIALVFLATRFTAFPGPLPPGYINLGDVVVMVAAVMMGPVTGLIAGAVGSAFADLAYGAIIYIPVTFIVKGFEGYLVGVIARKGSRKQTADSSRQEAGSTRLAEAGRSLSERNGIAAYGRNAVAVIAGAVVMVLGYFLTEAFILGLIDNTFGYAYAFANLPLNLIQGSLSIVVSYVFINILRKAIPVKQSQ